MPTMELQETLLMPYKNYEEYLCDLNHQVDELLGDAHPCPGRVKCTRLPREYAWSTDANSALWLLKQFSTVQTRWDGKQWMIDINSSAVQAPSFEVAVCEAFLLSYSP